MMVKQEVQRRGRQFQVNKGGCLKTDASLDSERLDLKRLVWDPEYRKATRHLWRQAG